MKKVLLTVLTFLSLSNADNTTSTLACKAGWTIYHDSCFIAVPLKQNWTLAKAICGSSTFSGKLAELETMDKKTFLVNYMAKTYEKAFAQDMFWIGGTDENSEGQWHWVSSTSPLTYQDWWGHATPTSDTSANCLAIGAPTQNMFNNLDCNADNNFVCETRAQPTQGTNNGTQSGTQTGSGVHTGNTFIG